jgi:FAD/FMN-containing dehydrogenase
MATTAAHLGVDSLAELRGNVRGPVLVAEDVGYDDARAVWNGMHDRRPAVVVRCSGVADVIAALRFAREHDLTVAVRGGGHSFAGFSTVDDGMVIDLGGMRGVRVDPSTRRAVAQTGARWGDFDRETQVFGLAVTGGLVSTTGIAGFSLGGGIGWLVRKYGMTVDNLFGADVVTADGAVVHASADENADLFWGLRGGGGNFGIVTSLEYRLHEVGPMVTGGAVFCDAAQAREILTWYREWTQTLPDEVTSLVNLTTAPPAPFIPEAWHGKPVIVVAAMHCGSAADGERALQAVKQLPGIVADVMGPIPYAAQQAMLDPLFPPGDQFYAKAGFIRAVDDSAVDALLEGHARRSSPMSEMHLHHLGGAMARVPADSTAVGERTVPWLLNVIGRCPRSDDPAAEIAWARRSYSALGAAATGSAYMNFLSADGDEAYRSAFGGQFTRLRELKRRWDPSNVFRLNQNIEP